MLQETTLNLLQPGQSAEITRLEHNADMNRRLRELGLPEGERVDCLYRSPWGSPAAYRVGGAVVAIRRQDASKVYIQPVEGLPAAAARKRPVIALAGNPNVGKSTLFNSLTGLRQHTGNWAGKTVAVAEGTTVHHGCVCRLVDLPGTYSLLSHSPEEEVAREFLCSGAAEAVIVVCDATCLTRSLQLAMEVMALFPRTVVCLNLIDEAEKNGLRIDRELLQSHLGVPVVCTCAQKEHGLSTLMDAVLALLEQPVVHRSPALPMPCPPVADPEQQSAVDAAALRQTVHHVLRDCVVRQCSDRTQCQSRLDRLLTSRLTGIPVMLLLLLAVLWLTITGANYPSQLLAQWLFGLEQPLVQVLAVLGAPPWLRGLLVEGCWRVLAWVVSVMLPPMAIFFPLFTLLEDLGYLPRAAFNLDHLFQRCHACGKQCLTLCMGLGCNAAGVTGCRIIDSPRERLIAILTNSFIPCNGRFPTLVTLIGLFWATGEGGSVPAAVLLTLTIGVGVAMTFAASWLLSRTLLRGIPSSFTLELPPFRRPRIGQVLVRSILDRTLFVLGRAVVVAAPAGLLLWALANSYVGGASLLTRTAGLLDPLGRLLGMDGVLLLAFILGFPANEIVLPIAIMAYTAAGSLHQFGLGELHGLLLANGWTGLTALSVILFSLLHWPCSTTCLTIYKETGSAKWTAVAMVLPTLFGVVLCAAVAAIARLWGGF